MPSTPSVVTQPKLTTPIHRISIQQHVHSRETTPTLQRYKSAARSLDLRCRVHRYFHGSLPSLQSAVMAVPSWILIFAALLALAAYLRYTQLQSAVMAVPSWILIFAALLALAAYLRHTRLQSAVIAHDSQKLLRDQPLHFPCQETQTGPSKMVSGR